MFRYLYIFVLLFIFINVSGQDPYFRNTTSKYPTTTIGIVSNIYQTNTLEVYNIGVSLTAIGKSGFGFYMEGKWGSITRYNIGLAIRLMDLLKLYAAIGGARYNEPYCKWYANYAGGVVIVLPIRLGFQVGVDYGNGYIYTPYTQDISINVGINYTL